MYESPVGMNIREVEMKAKEDIDGMIIEAVHEVGIFVDKDELIKALEYDRKQYYKGYSDGTKDVASSILIEVKKTEEFYGISLDMIRQVCENYGGKE